MHHERSIHSKSEKEIIENIAKANEIHDNHEKIEALSLEAFQNFLCRSENYDFAKMSKFKEDQENYELV